jgi:hypothetical protein
MRRSLVVAALAAALIVPADASERQTLRNRLSALSAKNPQAASAAWALYDCSNDASRRLGSRDNPALTDADWAPTNYRPSIEALAGKAMAECTMEEQRLAAAVASSVLKTFKASIARINVEDVKWVQSTRCTLGEPYGCIKLAPSPRN